MAIAYLKSGKEARVLQGNPWVFRSDIDRVSGAWEPGDVVSVKSARGRMLGCAFYNPQSQISLRFVTFRDERVNADFIRARIHRAVEQAAVCRYALLPFGIRRIGWSARADSG